MDKCCKLNYSRIVSISFSSHSNLPFFNCLFFFYFSYTCLPYMPGKADTYFSNMLLPWCFSNCSAESEKENSEWEKFNCSIVQLREKEGGAGEGYCIRLWHCCAYFLPWKGSELEFQKEGKAWAEQQAEYIFCFNP